MPDHVPPEQTRSGRSHCLTCVIRKAGICRALTDEQLVDFHRIGLWRTYQPGERILSSQDDVRFLAAINKGAVKVTKILIDGRSQIVGLLFPPDCFGHTFGECNAHLVEALTEVEICRFNHEEFGHMAGKYPGLNDRLLSQALEELDAAQDWMVLLGQKSAEERVASFLLKMANRPQISLDNRSSNPNTGYFSLHLGRKDIAECLGLNYDTVCRHISTLRKRNIVEFDGPHQFRVPDMGSLTRLAG